MGQRDPSLIAAAHDPTAAADLKIYSEAFDTAVSGADPAPGFDKVEKTFLSPLPNNPQDAPGDFIAEYDRAGLVELMGAGMAPRA